MKKNITITIDEELIKVAERYEAETAKSVSHFFEHAGYLMIARYSVASGGGLSFEKGKEAMQLDAITVENRVLHGQAETAVPAKEPMSNKKIVKAFSEYLYKYLEGVADEYHWSYEVDPESHVSWMSPELFSGETNDDSNRFLECCGEALNRGIDTDDSKLVFEAVRRCMDWAGAFYDFRHGPQKGNETVVKKLFDDGTIVEFMRKSRDYILSGNIESLEYYTSGWAIVWYVLDPDKMIILGSREVCGLNKILIDFKKEYNIEKLPREINFGQLVYRDNKRFIEGIKYVYTPKGKLKMYKKILKILNTVKDLGGYACCHEIDRKLFMIGR